MRPAAQKFKRPQRTPPPPAAVASRCARCCGEIDEDDEYLVDLCMACDRLRHRELAAAKRSAEKVPISPDSVMAGLHAMRVGPNHVSSPASEPSDGPATGDATPLDSRAQQSLKPPARRQGTAHRSTTAQCDLDAEFTSACREDESASSPGTAAHGAAAECATTSHGAEEAIAAAACRPRAPAPSPAICSETNRQAAEEWLARARHSFEAGDDAAAVRLCEKSLRLHGESSNAGAAALAEELRKFGPGSAAAEAAARVLRASGHHVLPVLLEPPSHVRCSLLVERARAHKGLDGLPP